MEKHANNMLLHYLKIVFRDILKNKFRYLLTTLGIAVGMTIFVMLNFIRDVSLHYNRLDFSNEKKLYEIETVYEKDGVKKDNLIDASFSAIEKLQKENIPDINYIAYGSYESDCYVMENKSEKAVFKTQFRYVNIDFFRAISARFIHGSADAWSKRRLAVVTEEYAKKLFGKTSNAVGKQIELRTSYGYDYGVFTVAGVIKPVFASKYSANVYLEYDLNWNKDICISLVSLKEGVPLQHINSKIKTITMGCKFTNYGHKADQEGMEVYSKMTDLTKNKDALPAYFQIIFYLLASVVLIIALFNFFNLLIGSVQSRIRQFTLRKIVGASRWALLIMLLCEVIPILVSALLGSYCFLELLISWYRSSPVIPPESREFDGLLPLIYFYPLKIAGWTLAVSVLVTILLTNRIQKIVLIQGVRGKLLRTNRNHLRNIILFFQLFLTVLFLSFSSGIFIGAYKEKKDNIYKTLSLKQSQAIFNLKLNGVYNLPNKKNEIVARAKQIPGVIDVVLSNVFSTLKNGVNILNENGEQIATLIVPVLFEGYEQFYELKQPLPCKSLAPDEIIANDSLVKLLQRMGRTTLKLPGGTFKIVGTIPCIPYTHESEYAALFSPREPTDCFVKCRPEQAEMIKKQLMELIREYVPETIPYEIISLYEEMNKENKLVRSVVNALGAATLMSLIITLFGVFTAVSADTKRRRKEIAIRKINGATYRNILWQFMKLYAILLIPAGVISIPFYLLGMYSIIIDTKGMFAGVFTVFYTWLIITLFVFLTIYNQIRRIAKENPAEVIKSE